MSSTAESVLSHFRSLCAIPHGTYHIDAISDYLKDFALQRGLSVRQDELKNVIIHKDATPGYENEPAVILQGHMDMVAVCDDPSKKNMLTDGLDLTESDGYLYAKGTSLGGDDGIALAYAMAILEDDSIPHPDLTAVFTVNEEVGMDGALGIDLSDTSAKRLLNIDSEEEGVITVSCAGGVRLHAALKGETKKITAPCVFLSLNGLLGGHSGTEIHKMRANGAHLIAEILAELADEYEIRLISMSAGEKDNAIPASASAEFLVPDLGDPDEFMHIVEEIEDEYRKDYEGIETDISLFAGIQLPQECICFSEEDTERFLDYINEVPDGVIEMFEDIDMVKTSLNLGILKCTPEGLTADYALRSNVSSGKEEITKEVIAITEEYKGEWETFGDYPAWEYLENSPFREKAVSVYEELYGEKPVVTGVHAGLECGILAEKIKGLDAISIGPNILNIHTTREKLDLASVERTWKFILNLLARKDRD